MPTKRWANILHQMTSNKHKYIFPGYMHLLSELTKVGNVSREEFEGMLLVYYRRIWRYVVYYMFNLSLSWFNVE